MQGTIRTRYTGPRGFAGSIIEASGHTYQGRRTKIKGYNHAQSLHQNHERTAYLWMRKHILPGAVLDLQPTEHKRGGYVWTWTMAEEVTP